MNQVQNISFHGQTVPVFSHNNQHYVAMKPIVENIGLDWVSQYKKIQRSEILKSGMVMMTIPATDGKTYETACLPLDYLNGWLFGVDARRVKPEIRSRLLTYQRECFRVLNEHFNPRVGHPKPTRALPDGLTGEQIEAVKKLHNALTKSAPKEAQARIAITLWSAVKSKFGCSYKEVPAEQFPEVLSVMSRVAVENGVLYGEVLDAPPKAEPKLPIDNNSLADIAAMVYYGTWMIELGKDISAPLKQLGNRQAVTMWTVWHETRSILKRTVAALEVLRGYADKDTSDRIAGCLEGIYSKATVR
ncbi:phage antirepressor N-terminal domain-containing protein [Neisseria cinerea]|uniref:phage antirepressor N-terminal domain-containing protein n=1 Tax=Neisseria cinerea TaxID=483 RepID=UPI000DA32034|nr:phage antirepressor N-terminal domain-containing protein [Neisseria cinerea]SQF83119.1 putative phage related protein [Neisseria cinerea]